MEIWDNLNNSGRLINMDKSEVDELKMKFELVKNLTHFAEGDH